MQKKFEILLTFSWITGQVFIDDLAQTILRVKTYVHAAKYRTCSYKGLRVDLLLIAFLHSENEDVRHHCFMMKSGNI